MSSLQSSVTLAAVVTIKEYLESRHRYFPSRGSLDWFIRVNRAELVEAGAILKMRDVWHIHSERFDQAVLNIAEKASKLAAA